MVKVALLSGGKDSLLAAIRAWPIDVGLVLSYSFPEPSPHLVNLGATLQTLSRTGIPILLVPLPRGREKEATVRALKLLGATTLVAGDVYIEDHLRYLESIASEAGAKLVEPLWGEDTGDLLLEVVERGIRATIIGARTDYEWLLGRTLDESLAHEILEKSRHEGWDPLGENGEYHTIVTDSPLHTAPLRLEECGTLRTSTITILKLRPQTES